VQNFTYTYDRYGNRWAQNAPQGGPALSISFNQANNIINTSGFVNDATDNVSDDTFHTYSYDADGNLISVDGGATATYYYDSLNQRVRVAPTRGTYEFVYDTFGRRVSTWLASTRAFVESNAYTDQGPTPAACIRYPPGLAIPQFLIVIPATVRQIPLGAYLGERRAALPIPILRVPAAVGAAPAPPTQVNPSLFVSVQPLQCCLPSRCS